MLKTVDLQKFILNCMLAYVFILYYLFSVSSVVKNLFLFFLLALLLCNKLKDGTIRLEKENLVVFFFSAFALFINVIVYGFNYYVVLNIVFLLTSILCIDFFAEISCDRLELIRWLFSDYMQMFYNIYFWINIIIIHVQARETGFLMFGYESNYDNITGFFGPGNTHCFCIYCMLITCLNLEKIYSSANLKKIWNIIYTIFTVVAMISTITINDNTAFIVVLPVGVVIYAVIKNKIRLNSILKGLMALGLVAVCAYLVYWNNETIKSFMDGRFLSKINAYIFAKNNGLTESGFGDERIRALEFSMKYGNGWFLGKGLVCNLSDRTNFEWYNFYSTDKKTYVGMSDISGVTYLCGIWFYFLWCLMITRKMIVIYAGKTGRVKWNYHMLCYLLIIVFTVYTTIFRSQYMAIILALYVAFLGYSHDCINKK